MSCVVKLNLVAVLTVGITGCASLQSVPSKMKSFVFRSETTDDPLVTDGKVSKSYKSAKRELKNADVTMLKFADWCEHRGDYLEAKQRYQDILNDDPENIDARLGIARVEFATGRKDEAEAIIRAAAKKYPDNAQVWLQMGRIQTAREQWGAASQSLLTASKLAPNEQEIRYELGLALARSERHEEALDHLKYAVGESAALYNIGFVLFEAERLGEAKHWFSRALESHPDERTRAMTTRMLADLGASGSLLAGPRIVPGSQPKSRVNAELTSYQAYRETPKNWKTTLATSQQATGRGLTPSDADVRVPVPELKNISQVSFTQNRPAGGPAEGRVKAEVPMWRGPKSTSNVVSSPVSNSPQASVEPPIWRSKQ